MLHVSAVNTLSELKKPNGEPVEFSIKYIVMSTGAIVQGNKCICTSSNFNRRTRNIKFMDSGEIRKIRNVLIIEFNGQEIFI